jgi:hypothetical protein
VRTLSRLAGWLRLEDLLVTALVVIVLPLLDHLVTGSAAGGTGSGTGAGDPPSLPAALFGLVAMVCVGACVLTRGPGEPPPLQDGTLTLQGWARFPLAAGAGIAAVESSRGTGLDLEPLVGILFLVTFVGALIHPRLPVVPVAVRRGLMLPMTFVAAAAFNGIIGHDMGGVFADLIGGAQPQVAAFWPIILGAVVMLYVMLVVAPRSIADPGANGAAWAVRFLFLAVCVVGAAAVGIR